MTVSASSDCRGRLARHLDDATAGPYISSVLIVVAQTAAFTAQAKAEGMTEAEITTAINMIAANPTGGVSLGAGLYKVRIPREGGGKSGGYRLVTLYVGDDAPVVLLAVLSKSNAANFTPRALAAMKDAAKAVKGRG